MAGGFFGAGWLVENRPELFEDIGVLLNEGGGGVVVEGQVQFGVEVTQDERVTEENVRRGVEMTLKILERFAATRPIMEDG